MPISTPEFRQKACKYCGTPALHTASKCTNCGSILPISLPASVPKPVARVVEAQSRWPMWKTALVTSGGSLLLGALYRYSIPNVGLAALFLLLWLAVIMPGMIGISAVASAKRDAGRVVMNILAGLGLWVVGLMLAVTTSASF